MGVAVRFTRVKGADQESESWRVHHWVRVSPLCRLRGVGKCRQYFRPVELAHPAVWIGLPADEAVVVERPIADVFELRVDEANTYNHPHSVTLVRRLLALGCELIQDHYQFRERCS